MNGVIIATWPIALLIVLAIVGIPLWMTLRHRHAAPDHREARAHDRATRAAPARLDGGQRLRPDGAGRSR